MHIPTYHRSQPLVIVCALVAFMVGLMACSGSGSNEEPNTPEPPDTTPPAAPSGLSATSGDGEASLEWGAVSASDLEGYNLYRATSSIGSVSDLTPINSTPLSETSFTDADVSNGTVYYYRVTAMDDSDNESDGSSEVEVTPFPDPPERP